MISSNIFDTLAEAYIEGLKDLLLHGHSVPSVTDPTSPASNFGKSDRPAIELLGYSFQVNNPYSSLFQCDAKVIRLPYCIGLLLWSLAGSNSVDWLSYYNPIAIQYSDDGKQLCGAFGKRLFSYHDRINQMEEIYARLKDDPSTRRALGLICTPEDNVFLSREYPCCIAVQYFHRDGALNAITYMRAQQALTVLPFDAFLFMSLQCLLASRLGLNVGYYKHIAGTFHIYEAEIEQAKQVISKGATPVEVGHMPDSETRMGDLLFFEKELREATLSKDIDKIEQMIVQDIGKDTFYDQAKAILLLHSLVVLELPANVSSILRQMIPPMSRLAENYIKVAK